MTDNIINETTPFPKVQYNKGPGLYFARRSQAKVVKDISPPNTNNTSQKDSTRKLGSKLSITNKAQVISEDWELTKEYSSPDMSIQEDRRVHLLYNELLTLMPANRGAVESKIQNLSEDDIEKLRDAADKYIHTEQLTAAQRNLAIEVRNLLYPKHPPYENLLKDMREGSRDKAIDTIKRITSREEILTLLGASERHKEEFCTRLESEIRVDLNNLISDKAESLWS
jgi:hypothetical protein